MHKVSYCRHRELLSPSPSVDPYYSSPFFPFYFSLLTTEGTMMSHFPITFFRDFDGDGSTQEWENLRLLRDVAVNIKHYNEGIFPGFDAEVGEPMEEEEQERMFPEYVVLNEENVWEEPIFTSLSRCSSLTSLGGDYSDYLSEEKELSTPHVPKIKSIKLIYSPMKDSGIELDPAHECATESMAKGTSKKRHRNDQAPYSSHMEDNRTEKKRRKNTARKTESVRTYSRKQKKEIPVDQPAPLRKSNALESKAKINPRKRQQSEEAPSSLAVKKRKQSAKQVKEIPAVNDSQTPKSTSPKSKQTPHREDSDPEKRVKKSTAKRQRHC